VEDVVEKEQPRTLTDWLRVAFKWFLDPAAAFLNRLGIHPNVLTFLGLLGNAFGAYLISLGLFTWGGLAILLTTPIDALDGALARLRGEPEDFGAFVDSVFDRYGELLVYAALLWYAVPQDSRWLSMAVYFAAFGSMLVSYTRARAQSLGLEAKGGLFTRVERFLIMGPALLFNIPFIGVAIIAVGANLTALQRIWHVRKVAYMRTAKPVAPNRS
jgi:CDP-diacylglycerol--glycerol-3-phosphate 3-phosphatidyltransferase